MMSKSDKIGCTIVAVGFFIFAIDTMINGEFYIKGVHIIGIHAYAIGIMELLLSIAMFYAVFRKTS